MERDSNQIAKGCRGGVGQSEEWEGTSHGSASQDGNFLEMDGGEANAA